MKYGIIKVKRAFLYEENGVDVVDEVFFGWSVMWEDEGEWIEVWTHYGYRGWMERNLIEEKSREWMEEREKAGNTYVVTRGFADVMRGARVQSRMLETLGRGCFVEKMEETENGYCRVKLANGISGFVPEVALRKRLDSDRFLWGKSEERFFVEQGIPEGWSEEKFRRKVVECAKGYLGCQYRWGGKAADGIDCSGVVFMVYLMNGVFDLAGCGYQGRVSDESDLERRGGDVSGGGTGEGRGSAVLEGACGDVSGGRQVSALYGA